MKFLGGLFVLLLGVSGVVGGIVLFCRQIKFWRNSYRTKGTVTYIDHNIKESRTTVINGQRDTTITIDYFTYVNFKDNNGISRTFKEHDVECVKSLRNDAINRVCPYKLNQEVKVLYDSNNPDKAQIKKISTFFWFLFLIILGLFFIGLAYLIFANRL